MISLSVMCRKIESIDHYQSTGGDSGVEVELTVQGDDEDMIIIWLSTDQGNLLRVGQVYDMTISLNDKGANDRA